MNSRPLPQALTVNTSAWERSVMAETAMMVMLRLWKSTADTADKRPITTA